MQYESAAKKLSSVIYFADMDEQLALSVGLDLTVPKLTGT